ncbi:MAG: DinB family protein [Chloroflexi bacterium]|nr:DinB family protein [Chloroflexota bacterium]
MNREERQRKIESYGNAYHLLTEALRGFPQEMWHYKPSPSEWSIHELLVHIADSEANSFIRCRRAVAEPGSAVLGYDEAAWARQLRYAEQSAEDALELFRWLRGNTYRFIKTLAEPVWAQTIVHSEIGTMTLDDWLTMYEDHVPDHLRQMRGVVAAWKASAG